MPILTKDEIIQKSDDLKKRIFKYKTLINIYDRVKLQYYENQLNELILKHLEIEEWEWMGWPSKEEYEKEITIIRKILEEQFKDKSNFSYMLGFSNR